MRAASERDDVVVVYLHWGREGERCPTVTQQRTARAVARAGADVIVGAHAHVLLGAGWLGETYVSYGLGNFLWYHNHEAETGVLQVKIRDGAVVADPFAPARIQTYGHLRPLYGAARADAVADWRDLRAVHGVVGTARHHESRDQGGVGGRCDRNAAALARCLLVVGRAGADAARRVEPSGGRG